MELATKPKPRFTALTVALLIGTAVAGGSGVSPWVSHVWAGEQVVAAQARATLPTVGVVVRVGEPESLPAATELQDWLVEHLRKQRKQFRAVLSLGAVLPLDPHLALTEDADFLLVIDLTHLSPYDDAPRRFWRPIAVHGPGGTRALHSSQVPLEAQLSIYGRNRARPRLQTTMTAQSTGRTVTAGTTKPVAILMGERMFSYLKRVSREGVFEAP